MTFKRIKFDSSAVTSSVVVESSSNDIVFDSCDFINILTNGLVMSTSAENIIVKNCNFLEAANGSEGITLNTTVSNVNI